MINYKYSCLDQTGKEISGTLEACDIAQARRNLKDRGLSVVSIEDTDSQNALFKNVRLSRKNKKITDTDIYNMSREISVLLKAGIRIDDAIGMIMNSTANANLLKCLSDIQKDIRTGKPVAESFDNTSKFSHLTVIIIRVGESVGDLRMAFEHISRHLKFQIQFRTEIINALTYPIFLVAASAITLFVIFKFIIPRFFSIFGQQQEKYIPFTAKILFKLSDYLNIYVIVGLTIAVVALFNYAVKHGFFHKFYAYAASMPLIGQIVLNLELSRFTYSMYTMLSSGIEFIKALKLSTELVQNEKIRNAFDPAVKLIREGRSVSDVFSQISLMPDIAVNLIRVGERSGNMKEIFLELFDVFDDRFKRTVKRIIILIEPSIITLMGVIVGFIVISLMLTVMSVGNIKL
ncbi:general secretion pathway protein F [Candidatus Magnetoovum chiemensis]|nr:general secretion pathway protein F [Candidatus Magnetoovum chiemensis]